MEVSEHSSPTRSRNLIRPAFVGRDTGMSVYSGSFYESEGRSAAAGARVIVPLVHRLIAPASVVDFGCGRGEFLREFQKLGTNVFGVDGAWASEMYRDGALPFLEHDLRTPLLVDPRDLAVCLETAEHLEEEFSEGLIDTLTHAAPAVLFSAAVPGQGGTHHVNERFPRYWQRKFAQRGYVPFDVIRPIVLPDRSVPVIYAQTTVLYAKGAGGETGKPEGPFGRLCRLGYAPVSGSIPFIVRDDWAPWMGTALNVLPARAREIVYERYRKGPWSALGHKVFRPGRPDGR